MSGKVAKNKPKVTKNIPKVTKNKPKVTKNTPKVTKSKPKVTKIKPKCGLCGKTGKSKKALTKTPCCNNWICNDAHKYVPFSFALNSCYRNHDRYTLCSYHFTESHQGSWKDCKECKDEFNAIDYNDYSTNYNFEEFENPEKISCVNCDATADTLDAFPLKTSNGYYCTKEECQKAGLTKNKPKVTKSKPKVTKIKPKCGLCGKIGKGKKALIKTPCCDNWICNDARKYVPFSYSSSCYRNHDRYTLCSYHFTESHQGSWKDCKECKEEFNAIDYNDYSTNYNFEKLENPEKISCVNCDAIADTLDAFPLKTSNGYYCTKEECQKAGFTL